MIGEPLHYPPATKSVKEIYYSQPIWYDFHDRMFDLRGPIGQIGNRIQQAIRPILSEVSSTLQE